MYTPLLYTLVGSFRPACGTPLSVYCTPNFNCVLISVCSLVETVHKKYDSFEIIMLNNFEDMDVGHFLSY